MRIRILLADDHEDFRRSLRQLLERYPDFEVVAEASSAPEAVSQVQLHQPDVVVLDVRMQNVSGIEAIPLIRESAPQTAVMMLSMHRDHRYVVQCLKAGARDYLLKDSDETTVVNAIRRLSPVKSIV